MSTLKSFVISFIIGLIIFGMLAFLIMKIFFPDVDKTNDDIQASINSSLNLPDIVDEQDKQNENTVEVTDKYKGDTFALALGIIDEENTTLSSVVVLKIDEENQKIVYMPFCCTTPINFTVTGSDGEKYPVNTNLGQLYNSYGASHIVKRLTSMMGIQIDNYMFLSKKAIINAVKELGGVNFTVPYDIVESIFNDLGEEQINTLLTSGTRTFSANEAVLALFDKNFSGDKQVYMNMHVDFMQSIISSLLNNVSKDKARSIIKNICSNSDTDYVISNFDDNSELIFASAEFEQEYCNFPVGLSEISGEASYGVLLDNYKDYR